MDMITLSSLTEGFAILSDPWIYVLIVFGSLVGLVFGATPGLTAPAAIALILPITYGMGIHGSLALLLGVYVSGYFSGSIPAILINTPGTPGNAATTLEGYPMARSGRANEALTVAVVSSFIGVGISVLLLLTLAPLMARLALTFTSVEYFALAVLGILCVAGISQGSLTKGLAAALFGILVSTVGLDGTSGVPRFTFGMPELLGGIAIIPALIGLFAISEMLMQSRRNVSAIEALPVDNGGSIVSVIASHVQHRWIVLKSAVIGTFIGLLPGTGPAIASWIAYGDAVRTKKAGDQFGRGEIKGLIACETSNNAVIGGAMIPLLTLGIPGDPVTAILIGAMMIQGVEPGPFFLRDHSGLFIAIIIMLMLSNIAMVATFLPLRRLASKILLVPYHIIVPIVVVVAATAAYAVSYSAFDILLLGVFGFIGFLMMTNGFPVASVVLGIVLGPILEKNFRNALIANDMDMTVFITRPISGAIFLSLGAVVVLWQIKLRRDAKTHRASNQLK
jgi:putative tricarboxylic transport membrane protein